MKTDVTAVGAGIYEPPRMTMVPIRTSGAMLLGSAPIGTMDLIEQDFLYYGQYGGLGNTATEWYEATEDGFGDGWDNFF